MLHPHASDCSTDSSDIMSTTSQQRQLRPASIASLVDTQPESSPSESPLAPSPAPLTQSQSEPTSSSRDRRISAACAACKKRKSKCTGGPPPCKLCRLSGIECIINESLDGRRKLAAKRVQDELQQQKAILDGFLDVLRTGDNARSQHLLNMVRNDAPLSDLAANLFQPEQTSPPEHRTKVPIDLLIEAQEVLERRATEDGAQTNGQYPRSTSNESASSKRRSSKNIPAAVSDIVAYQSLVETLRSGSESDSQTLLRDLRRLPDISGILQYFQQAGQDVTNGNLNVVA